MLPGNRFTACGGGEQEVSQPRIRFGCFEQSFPSCRNNPAVSGQSRNGVSVLSALLVTKYVSGKQELQRSIVGHRGER